MDDRMKRFLASIKIDSSDPSFLDLSFGQIRKADGDIIKYSYTIKKNKIWDFPTLNRFISSCQENIKNYKYEFTFLYQKYFTEDELKQFINDYIFNRLFDEFSFDLFIKNKIFIFFQNEEDYKSFLLIENSLKDLFNFINYHYDIKAYSLNDSEFEALDLYNKLKNHKNELNKKKEEVKEEVKKEIKEEIIEEKEKVEETQILKEETKEEFNFDNPLLDDLPPLFKEEKGEPIKDEIQEEESSPDDLASFYSEFNSEENIQEETKEEPQKTSNFLEEVQEQYRKENEITEKAVLEEIKIESQRRKIQDQYQELRKKAKDYPLIDLKDINQKMEAVAFKGKLFQFKETRETDRYISVRFGVGTKEFGVLCEYNLSKEKDSEMLSLFRSNVQNKVDFVTNVFIKGKIKEVRNNLDYTIYVHHIEILEDDPLLEEEYLGETKRVELHLHTNYSDLDGITKIKDYINNAKNLGMTAIGVTDHAVVQSFPEAQIAAKKAGIKMLYGCELYMINDYLEGCFNPKGIPLKDATFVAFDVETTGLSIRLNKITEIGAVKIVGGLVVDTFNYLVNPEQEINEFIEKKTHITNDMVKNEPTIDKILPKFLEFVGDSILIAHNADFDYEMVNEAYKKLYHKEFIHPIIDSLALSRYIFPENRGHSLKNLCNRLEVEYDTESAHRAEYDAQVLASCWNVLKALISQRIKNPKDSDLANLEIPQSLLKNLRGNHVTVFARNKKGLKNLYKIVSESHTNFIGVQRKGSGSSDGDNLGQVPLTPRRILQKYRDNLLVGSACFNSEVFYATTNRNDEKLDQAISFYDFIELQPLENYSYLINVGDIHSLDDLKFYLRTIISHSKKLGKTIVATSDCHYLRREDKIFRDVYISINGLGGTRHPLNPYFRKNLPHFENPDQHFRTTKEMLDAFSWLEDEKEINEYVIENTNKIASLCEEIVPIDDKLYTPTIENVEQKLTDLVYNKAHELYGDDLPPLISKRISDELNGIITNGFSVIYYIAHELVRMTNERGYIVGSRGSVGSSFVAFLGGITEVNALAPHYRCPKCKHFEWHDTRDGVTSGYDLEDKRCPICGEKMEKDGQNIPFETFLGFNAEKTPDIDLNFPADFQSTAHDFTKDLLGVDKVYRAGTISSVEFKTSVRNVKDYLKSLNIDPTTVSRYYIEALAAGAQGVKRTTGQHPGGIIVIPKDYDVYDFTPIQYPANEIDKSWLTTHFAYKALHETILKLDMLGHVDPQALKMMCDLSGVKLQDIEIGNKDSLSLFTSNKVLKLQHKYIKNDVGTTGIPEFGTNFVKQLLREVKPKTFSDLVIVSGLSHGTNVWTNNAQTLIQDNVTNLRGVIGCRDDIMTYLISMGIEKSTSFTIMEKVRKGKKLSPSDIEVMKSHNVPQFYIDSCDKIQYLFPKGHATAYVIMALRVAYFKVHYPLEYYATFFTLRCDQYDIETMLGGIDSCYQKLESFQKRRQSRDLNDKLSNKEEAIEDTLIACLEFFERGYSFEKIDINKSDSTNFLIDKEKKSLILPFKTIDGLGESAGDTICSARREREYDSIKDFQQRGKVNDKIIKVLKDIGSLVDVKEEDTLDLFKDFSF